MSDLVTKNVDSSPEAPGSSSRSRHADPHVWLTYAEKYALPVLFVAAVVFFSVAHPDQFPTSGNIRVILGSQAVVGVIALALLVPIVGGHFDLSVGSTAVLCSILLASLTFEHGWPLLPACLVVVAAGMLIGVLNGILVTKFGIDSLIATLGGSFIIGGVITWYTNSETIAGQGSQLLNDLGLKDTLGVPRLAVLTAVLGVVVAYVLTQTPFGRRIRAIGSGADAARLVGIRVESTVRITFVVSGGLAGLAGVLMLAQLGTGNPSTPGLGLTLPAVAAVFLGASAFTPGHFNVLGTIVGLLLVTVFVSGLTLSGAQPWIQPVLEGASLIAAVGVSAAFRRRRLGQGN